MPQIIKTCENVKQSSFSFSALPGEGHSIREIRHITNRHIRHIEIRDCIALLRKRDFVKFYKKDGVSAARILPESQ